MKRLTFCYVPLPGKDPVTFNGEVSTVNLDEHDLMFTSGGENIVIFRHLIVSPISISEVKPDDAV